MITIVDYGSGNLGSVAKALRGMGREVEITSDPERVRRAQALVLPGVGSFGEAATNLDRAGMRAPVLDFIASGKPFLGICLGLQLLFEESAESPGVRGLGVFPGRVERFDIPLKVPHIGWNTVEKVRPAPHLAGIESGDYFYFVHSYYVVPQRDIAATWTEYGVRFISSIHCENVFACQFHPEKSQDKGLAIIRNFGACSC